MAQRSTHYTTDHDTIRQWAEQRGARPACVRGTGGRGDTGMIRLDFPGYSGQQKLQEISWEEWFEKFDENNLALAYQETTADGQQSNFNKIIGQETAAERLEDEQRTNRQNERTAQGPAQSRGGQRGSQGRTSRGGRRASEGASRAGSRSAKKGQTAGSKSRDSRGSSSRTGSRGGSSQSGGRSGSRTGSKG